MDAPAPVDEAIDYVIKGVGDKPATNEELSKSQPLSGTIVFSPGETRKTITVNVPTPVDQLANRNFEVSLFSTLAWVTPDPVANSVVAVVSTTPKIGNATVINNIVYNNSSTHVFTATNDFVTVTNGGTVKSLGGNDNIIVLSGINTIDCGNGNDQITLNSNSNKVICGVGDDLITLGYVNNGLNGGDGDETFSLGAGSNNINAGAGNDTILFSGFNNSNTIDGGAGIDTMDFSSVAKNYNAGMNIDLLNGTYYSRNDFSQGASGEIKGIEKIIGTANDDFISGGKTSSILSGGDGDDAIQSLTFNDLLDGGNGDDSLNGGKGGDILTGGSGKDMFIFNNVLDMNISLKKTDTITDFKSGEDKILFLFDLDKNKAGTQKDCTFIRNNAFSKTAGEVRYSEVYTEGSNTYILVQGDTNGDGKADFSLKLMGITSLEKSDIIFAQ
jgi:Ca2+-binding RTX toxin-like protein